MKRFLTLYSALFIAVLAQAVPADRTKFLYRQPDGSTILLQRHGDEFAHWTTDSRGQVMAKDLDGFYRPSTLAKAVRSSAVRRSSAQKRGMWSSYDDAPETNFGDRKILCLIANFSDSTFVIENPREKFDAMLNSEGYSYNRAIGSVRDYYMENSNGLYRPSFDVFGPVTLSKSSAYYDNYDKQGGSVAEAILEAYELLKDQINIADYDTDNDGDIDMVLFYYPGHNEAEGAGEESIWPHQGAGYKMLGSKRMVRYFCTSELRGPSGSVMCSIGTTCHEFAHSLGLPDFYDTDYEKSGGKNENTTGQFDLMCSGCYNDIGRRPPYLSAVERNMLGWMEAPVEITRSGNYTLDPVTENKAYMSVSMTEGEYFVYEYRTNNGWDSGLTESGMLVYHVDKSNNMVTDSGMTASFLWDRTNNINAYYGHPCFYLLESRSGSYVFPGTGSKRVTSLNPTAWDGRGTGLYISGISDSGTQVSFKATVQDGRSVIGMVKDSDGNPVKGARVVLSRAAYEFQAPSLLKDDVVVYTDNSGSYQFNLSTEFSSKGILTATADGYVPMSVNVNIGERFTGFDFTLIRLGQELPYSFRRYDPAGTAYVSDFGVSDIALAMKYPSSELEDYVGGKVASISFISPAETYTDVYVMVDFGSSRVLTKKITDQYVANKTITVDLASDNIVIPSGKDVYFGFGFTGLQNAQDVYNLYIFTSPDYNNGNYYSLSPASGPSLWNAYSFNGGCYLPPIEAVVSLPHKTVLSMTGVSYIVLADDVPTVRPSATKTVKEVKWTLDGNAVDTPPAVSGLPAGTHTYMALLVFYDGTTEKVIYDYIK